MKPFTKLERSQNMTKKSKGEEIFSDKNLSIVEYEEWSFVNEKSCVLTIIYLIEESKFIIRQEPIPTFKWVDGDEYYLTVLSGTIDEGEEPETTLLREIEEEAGIVIRPDFKFEFFKPLHFSKSTTAKTYPSIVTLTERDYTEVMAKGDGSRVEKMSKSVKLDIKLINSINFQDLPSEYLLVKFKEYLNIQ